MTKIGTGYRRRDLAGIHSAHVALCVHPRIDGDINEPIDYETKCLRVSAVSVSRSINADKHIQLPVR